MYSNRRRNLLQDESSSAFVCLSLFIYCTYLLAIIVIYGFVGACASGLGIELREVQRSLNNTPASSHWKWWGRTPDVC